MNQLFCLITTMFYAQFGARYGCRDRARTCIQRAKTSCPTIRRRGRRRWERDSNSRHPVGRVSLPTRWFRPLTHPTVNGIQITFAENEGFEPPEPLGSPVFKTGAFNQALPILRKGDPRRAQLDARAGFEPAFPRSERGVLPITPSGK